MQGECPYKGIWNDHSPTNTTETIHTSFSKEGYGVVAADCVFLSKLKVLNKT